ncbi:MAG TPA: hypothetical protein VNU94_04045 [Acidobacteriaceae bacterium]|jgi:hypothetical protein|nr:hypothetical protein [Acidobacteriaceae bacterium]
MSFSQYWREQTSLGYAMAQNDPRAARRNILMALLLILLFNICVFYALAASSLWPLIFGVVFLAWLAQRHAIRNRNKSLRIRERLLLGVQANLNQIPIFIGQLGYRISRTRRRKSR